jgi:dTDP-4-dehydrorhamnose reductase
MRNFYLQISIRAAADLVISPVTTSYVASGLKCIGAGEKSGVFHLSGEQDTTYYGLATAMAEVLGVRSIVEEDWVRHRLGSIPSPSYSALSMPYTFNTWGLKPQKLNEVAKELVMKINKK